MDYKRFREIFREEGIEDEEIVRDKWEISKLFIDPEDLDEDMLRWSIKEYILNK